MSDSRDPAIKLFGKTIQLPEIAVLAVDADGANPPSSSSPTAPEHTSERVGEEQGAAEKDPTGEPLTNTKKEDGAQPMIVEESIDPNATSVVNDYKKTFESEGAPVDDANTDDQKNETENPQENTLKKPDKILPCPRCNSMDTKFCYYNNYNVNQPRHFCKKCQRYWTAGGTMRNVPVGAGRRKNKFSAAHYRVSEALQNAQVDLPNGFHNPTLKTNGTVLTFGSDSQLCESMASVMKFSGKAMLDQSQNGVHKPELRIPISCGVGDNGDDHSCGSSSVTASNSKDETCKPRLRNGVIQSCHSLPQQLPGYPGAPWPYPWNTGQWNTLVPQMPPPGFCPLGFPMPFYPASPYWGCSIPVPGNWNVHWVNPTTSSGPNSLTLGKHSREENVPKSSDSFDNDSLKENNHPEKCLWVPKTLRIDDPEEAAKSSIWATLGIKNERADFVSGGGPFRVFQSKGNEKCHISSAAAVLQANPAAMSRSQSFRESA